MMELDKIYNEDCLSGLKKIPDNTIDCCVTSPPYYALRDYGTGHWEGGDPNCSHSKAIIKSRWEYSMATSIVQTSNKGTDARKYKDVCPVCGAIRVDDQIGLEETPQSYIDKLTEVFMEVFRVLKPEGTLWLNIGDSYNGYKGNSKSSFNDSKYVGGHGNHPTREGGYGLEDKSLKPKDLIGIPWMLAFSLRNAGWYLRQDIIWHKPNPMPESVTDRCTKSHEYIFLFSKNQKYYFDNEAIQENAKPESEGRYKSVFNSGKSQEHFRPNNDPNTEGMKKWTGKRNKRDVWSVVTRGDHIAHFATYPEELITPCILAGCPRGGLVLDPFMGSGTTARVARKLNRHFVGFELNPDYCEIINKKIQVEGDLFY